MTREEILINRDFLVCKSNKLIQHTAFDLSAQQQKIILFIISKIKPEDEQFKEYVFSLYDICEVFGIQKQDKNLKDLREGLQQLSNKSFWIEDEVTYKLCRWIEKVTIDRITKEVIIRLDNDLKPYLIQLSENYTGYELYNVLGLDSKYSIRLYEILKSYSNLGELKIEIEKLKRMFNCENKYKEFKEFKRNIILPAQEQLNKYTNITVDIEYIRENRAIKYIHFFIHEKKMCDRIEQYAELEKKLDKKPGIFEEIERKLENE